MKIYTKTGDSGETGLLSARVKKNNLRIEIIGQIDELMASLGGLIIELEKEYSSNAIKLKHIYKNLFIIQSYVADNDMKYNFYIDSGEINKIENDIDEMTETLPVLKNFIYCTGHHCSVSSHQVRAKIRTVERYIVTLNENVNIDLTILRYLNRLSDYFFTLARYINKLENIEEEILKI